MHLNIKIPFQNPEPHVKQMLATIFGQGNTYTLNQLTGGATNQLFKVSIAASDDAYKGPKTVLARINGNNTETIIDRDREEELLGKIAKFGMAPQTYGRFENGLVYEYYEGRPLKPQEMPTYNKLIANQMAKFHKLDIEYDHTPFLFVTIRQWLAQVKAMQFDDPVKQAKFVQLFDLNKIEQDIDELQAIISKYPIAFCHNDLLSLNLIYNAKDESAKFIDFEYCSYNYRGFDLGNHFCEYCGFDMIREWFPSKAVQYEYYQAYLEEFLGKKPTDEELHQLYVETNHCSLMSHLFWALWGLVQAKYSFIADFDHFTYAQMRLTWFNEWKQQFLNVK